MVRVIHEGVSYTLKSDETLLDGLLTHGVDVPHGCKAGTCQSCLLKCTDGVIPEAAQKGLRDAQKLSRLLLACQCVPESEMHTCAPQSEGSRLLAEVVGLQPLNAEVVALTLKPVLPFTQRPGQFIRLYNPDGIARCYSLSHPGGSDNALVLHVRAYPEGILSQWIHRDLRMGDTVSISEALGECFYIPGKKEQPLLLIGTGTGLAPLYGILHDALAHGHTGPIALYHGVRTKETLYLSKELDDLAQRYANFEFHACVSEKSGSPPEGVLNGRAADLALAAHSDLKGWSVFLCGNPDMVKSTQMQAFLAGASLADIHIDPFDHPSNSKVPG